MELSPCQSENTPADRRYCKNYVIIHTSFYVALVYVRAKSTELMASASNQINRMHDR